MEEAYIQHGAMTDSPFKIPIAFYQPVISTAGLEFRIISHGNFEIHLAKYQYCKVISNTPLCTTNQNETKTRRFNAFSPVSYTHLRAHETDSYLVCRLLLEKKK